MPEAELTCILASLPYVIFACIAGVSVWRRFKGVKA